MSGLLHARSGFATSVLAPCLVVGAILSASCGGSSGPAAPTKGTYTLRLFGFPEIERGQPLHLKLKARDAETVFANYDGSVRPDGTQEIVLESVLTEGAHYRVDYYLDVDRDGAYTRPTGTGFRDPSWRRFVDGEAIGVSDSQAHGDPFVDIFPF